MDRPDWKRVAGCALLVALAASLVRDPPASPPEWLLAGGGLGIAAGLAFPALGERGPVAKWQFFALAGVGGFWRSVAESSGPVALTTTVLGGAVLAAVGFAGLRLVGRVARSI